VVDEGGIAEPNLRFLKLFDTAEKALRTALDEAREKTSHPGDKGSDVEAEARAVFEKFLPPTFGVGQGTVYDAYGDRSAQADLVITNSDHPFRYPPTKTGAFMVEGVAAVGEIKSELTKKELKRSIRAAAKFKELRPTATEEERIYGVMNRSLIEVTGGVPPFFILAFENSIAIETILKILQSMQPVPTPQGKSVGYGTLKDRLPPVDCVCLLGKGVFLNFRAGNDLPLQFVDPEWERFIGWRWIETSAPLAVTLTWLHAEIPRIIRSSSIGLPYYAPKYEHMLYMEKAKGAAGKQGSQSGDAAKDK
jgi:hypothetical protein